MNFCQNLESSPLSPLMVALGSTSFIMIIFGFIRVVYNSKICGYVYLKFYLIVAIGSIVAVVFSALIFQKFDETLERCLLDNDIAEKRRNDPFLKWFQQKFKCCGIFSKDEYQGKLPRACCVDQTVECTTGFQDTCNTPFHIYIYTVGGIFLGGICFWALLSPLVIKDML
ncbi:hypothetical protein RF11_05573 [Thelohanellus kitauei]|uniref:Uncharacterized protein n=1 Tax=Thelohanellus kitauei TaxID=669202 RepID=A0A0C2M0F2_THEKT|nr:hypothetical protein RF11_05573 [Thelohanellus kitauei]